jgi:hypothetical protein
MVIAGSPLASEFFDNIWLKTLEGSEITAVRLLIEQNQLVVRAW